LIVYDVGALGKAVVEEIEALYNSPGEAALALPGSAPPETPTSTLKP
jgi:ABC-type phosphate/phosphonate transport system permease subunit